MTSPHHSDIEPIAPQPSLGRRALLSQLGSLCALATLSQRCFAAPDDDDTTGEPAASRLTYEGPQTQRWKFGLSFNTPVTCTNVFATFVVPMEWPEQKLTPINQTIDNGITGWEVKELVGGAKQVLVQMASVPAGSTNEISFEFDIERTRILPPEQIDDLVIPKRLSRDEKIYIGNSPHIDASNGRIRKVSRELGEREAENDWDRVEQIYDFVRKEVEYVEGPIRNASDALKDGKGDCEDLTSLFVAICRNLRIPARMVWIPDHCYPEFYLEDSQGNGTWFPCQAAGTRMFGRMDEYRPILQKGDRFKVPESRTPVRYVAEYLKADRKGKKNPRPTWIREMIDV
ncbi:Transglutaminase-like superfamily protein [Rubripirellula amarantea]|uniref:Transglutaminase-like superfamily protein n=1 Tax=Rubripirellula amarantea TaxID=2527999 RepID=A0A5C5WVA1_9BACT|nr:transglutaminase-like domain-containing protein [Rubripirellula amarantea]TWT54627.1 Transglutaminase-like superfamily protein [Rubripirellula amarantea]